MADLENNLQEQAVEDVKEEQIVQEEPQTPIQTPSDSVNISFPKVIEYGCYVFAVIFLIAAIVAYNKDLHCSDTPYDFREHRYVGGDAYNYIISASRSTAIMVKCLIMTISGFSFAIIGRITALINKK